MKKLLLLFFLVLPAVVQAQFNYTTNNGTIAITGYFGPGGAVAIPATINGLPVTRIEDYAFYSGTSLTSVTIGNSVTSIGDYAFYSCTNLTSVTIGNGVTSIGDYALYSCTSLSAITVDPLNFFYSSVDGVLFDKSQTVLIQYPAGRVGSYAIPNSVTSIGNSAFYYCLSLTSVTIGNGVTSIGFAAFYACTSLSAITVDALNSFYSSVDGILFNKSQTMLIQYPAGKAGSCMIPNSVTDIGYAAFHSCTSLTSAMIPNSVTSIGDYAFYSCTNLTSVTIGNSVTNIGDYAFYSCTSLTSVTIPNSVTHIGFAAFYSCTSLTGVYFQGNAPTVGSGAFGGGNSVTVYYLPGTTGWGATFADRPAVLWNPLVATGDASFGVQTNRFGFTITGSSNLVIVVEASTSLANPAWTPAGTNILTNGSSYFSDPQWTNHPARFYRLRSP